MLPTLQEDVGPPGVSDLKELGGSRSQYHSAGI